MEAKSSKPSASAETVAGQAVVQANEAQEPKRSAPPHASGRGGRGRGRSVYRTAPASGYAPFHRPAQFHRRFPLITPGQYGEWVDHEGLISHVFDIPGRFLQTELLQPHLVPRIMHARNRQRLQLLHKYTDAMRTLPEVQQVQQRIQQAAGRHCPVAGALLPAELDAFLFFWKSPRMLAMAPGTGVGFTMIQELPRKLDTTENKTTRPDDDPSAWAPVAGETWVFLCGLVCLLRCRAEHSVFGHAQP